MGKKAKLLFSWDEFDRLRKVPVNVAKADADMEKYIGCPYVDVKNPFKDCPQFKNYASMTADSKAAFLRTWTPSMVVPPGEVTLSTIDIGCSPVS